MPRKPNARKKPASESPNPQDQIALDGMEFPKPLIEVSPDQIEILDKFNDEDAINLIRSYNEANQDEGISTSYPSRILYKTGDDLSHIVFDETDDVINKGEKNIITKQKYSRNDSITKFSVIVDNENLKIGNRRLTPIEKAVMDSVITFFIFKEKYIPINSIVRKVLFKNPKFNPTKTQIQLIRDCLKMLSYARITIDCTEIANKKMNRAGMRISSFEKDSALLSYSEYKTVVNGHLSRVIEVLETPVLLEYAKLAGQVVIVKEDVLTTPVNKTIDAIIIQEYLIQQIVYYHGNKNDTVIIYYENIFSFLPERDLPYPSSIRSFKSKIYDVIHTILNYWKEIDLIKDYEIKNKSRIKYHHIIIHLNQQTPLIEKP